jgi:translation initiation factor eIF-2B subunit epsilon
VQADKRNLMTLIFKPASPSHRTRPLSDDAVLAIDPSTSQLLMYTNERTTPRIAIDPSMLADTRASQGIQLRYDLMDSHISICTPEVLMLFTDNFDWQVTHACSGVSDARRGIQHGRKKVSAQLQWQRS